MCHVPLNSPINLTEVLLAGEPLSLNSVDSMMEETPEMWKPDLWNRNGEMVPLKDEYDVGRVLRVPPGRFDIAKEQEESRSQEEI